MGRVEYLLELTDPRCADPAMSGLKAARLARSSQAGIDVPEAVVLTAAAHRAASALGDVLPDSVERAIIAAAARFDRSAMAVRSSPVARPTGGTGPGGRIHGSSGGDGGEVVAGSVTVLGVRGAEQLVRAVQQVWFPSSGSSWPVAVLIQRALRARVIGRFDELTWALADGRWWLLQAGPERS